MPEAEEWLARQEKLVNGKVDISILLAEGQRRGYCICPLPLSQMVDFKEFGRHSWCRQMYTEQSWEFWYKND